MALRPTVSPGAATVVWSAGLAITGLPVVWRTLRGVASGRFAADLVAMLAIVTALFLGEPLAGLIVVLMQTGGEALERYAEGRASEAVRELEAAAPRLAHRVRVGGTEDVEADAVAVGDELLVRPGELVPCDGLVLAGRSQVDAARLTGEPLPVSAAPGTRLLSGSLNRDGPLTIRATAPASESQYARIVELVRTAQESKSPLQRLADRYAVWFTPFTLLVCVAAYLLTGDPVRVLAVLVVATPCPLILAPPAPAVGGHDDERDTVRPHVVRQCVRGPAVQHATGGTDPMRGGQLLGLAFQVLTQIVSDLAPAVRARGWLPRLIPGRGCGPTNRDEAQDPMKPSRQAGGDPERLLGEHRAVQRRQNARRRGSAHAVGLGDVPRSGPASSSNSSSLRMPCWYAQARSASSSRRSSRSVTTPSAVTCPSVVKVRSSCSSRRRRRCCREAARVSVVGMRFIMSSQQIGRSLQGASAAAPTGIQSMSPR